MRQIVLDTETTGLEPADGHRIIEIGCVELFNRKLTGKHYHQYIQPEREIDEGAMEVHGITPEFLADKPVFKDIYQDFLDYVDGAQLVIHNAPFDVGFLNSEFAMLGLGDDCVAKHCTVLDTLAFARKKHPGQKNNLDALCKRYGVDNSARDLHGALLDSEILADVYLLMTGGQTHLALGGQSAQGDGEAREAEVVRIDASRKHGKIIRATDEELIAHQKKLEEINQASGGQCEWLKSLPTAT